MYVSWVTSHLKKHPPSKPLAVLLGGSSGREALVSGPSLAAQVKADGGPDIAAYNLSSRMQRYAQSWAIVDNLPDTPTTVLVGVNLGRFTTSPESNYNQVIGRELLLKSDSLRRWVTAHSGEHKYSYTILPGIFSALTSYLQQKENAWLKGKSAKPYKVHAFDLRKTLPDSEKRALVQTWLSKYYPAFKKVHRFDGEMLDGLIAEGQKRGLDMVIVELPWNRQIIGDKWGHGDGRVPADHQGHRRQVRRAVPRLQRPGRHPQQGLPRPVAPASGGAGDLAGRARPPAGPPVQRRHAEDHALMDSFKRGFRNRNPLVLIVAALCLVPALLGFQWVFTSGAWTAVPLDRALRNPEDSFTYISWMVGKARQDQPATPALYLLGGSSARESIVGGDSLAAEIRKDGGPRVAAYDLGSINQNFAESLSVVDSRAGHAGVAAGRRQPGPLHVYEAGERASRPRAARSCWTARPCTGSSRPGGACRSTRTPSCRASGRTSPGWAKDHGADLLAGKPPSTPYALHRYSEGDAALRQPEEAARDQVEHEPQAGVRAEPRREPADARGAAGAGQGARRQGRAARAAAQRGDRQGQLRPESQRQYQVPVAKLAGKYGYPYVDLNRQVDIPSRDFQDLSHLIAPGRVIWQHALAKELAQLLDAADSGGSGG